MNNESTNKPFNNSLLQKFDKPGKKTVRKLIEDQGYLVAYNPNDYAGDLIIMEEMPGGYYRKIAIGEVGVRDSWKTHYWPPKWESLRIEGRKAKYIETFPVWYFVLNHSFSSVMILDKNLLKYPIEKVSNCKMEDEEFYITPAWDCHFVEIEAEHSREYLLKSE